jgi:hypothetical protein
MNSNEYMKRNENVYKQLKNILKLPIYDDEEQFILSTSQKMDDDNKDNNEIKLKKESVGCENNNINIKEEFAKNYNRLIDNINKENELYLQEYINKLQLDYKYISEMNAMFEKESQTQINTCHGKYKKHHNKYDLNKITEEENKYLNILKSHNIL